MRLIALCAAAILAVMPAKADDTTSLDGIVAALYDVISGPAGEARDWERFKSLFGPEARLMAVSANAPTGLVVMTPQGYIDRSGAVLEKNGFYEREIARKMERFGDVVHIFSTYEARRAAEDEQPFARGVNSIQLHHHQGKWQILSVFWQAETETLKLPQDYLP